MIEKEEHSGHHIEADTVIFAVGQRPDLPPDCGLLRGRGDSVAVKDVEKDKSTSVEGIFAAGDVIYGTKSVIAAIESGREAAAQIDRFLGGDGDISEVLAPETAAEPYIGCVPGFGYQERTKPVIDGAAQRADHFQPYNHGICEADICREAGRCLQCDLRLQLAPSRRWSDFEGNQGVER